jgi:hypothetical protein
MLRASVAVAAPMLAAGDAGALFDAAFDAGLAAWPLHRARLQLAYGIWLRRRQRAGESRAPLLAGWFRIGNLSALRELALLWLAAKLASDPQRYRPGGQVPGSGRARERVLVALSGGPEGQTLIRRADHVGLWN